MKPIILLVFHERTDLVEIYKDMEDRYEFIHLPCRREKISFKREGI